MLPPERPAPRFLPSSADAPVDQGRQRHSARAFRHGLLALQQQQDGVGDLLLAHRHQVVHVPACQSKVCSPMRRTAMPSAMVGRRQAVARVPRQGRLHCRRLPGLHADHLHRRPSSLIAVGDPEMRPPPPTGTTTTSRSGTCSISSSPMVPWPAMTGGSSKGWTKTQPALGSISRALGVRLVVVRRRAGPPRPRSGGRPRP